MYVQYLSSVCVSDFGRISNKQIGEQAKQVNKMSVHFNVNKSGRKIAAIRPSIGGNVLQPRGHVEGMLETQVPKAAQDDLQR